MVCRGWLLRDLYLVWKVGEFGLFNEQLCYLLFRYEWIPDDEERRTDTPDDQNEYRTAIDRMEGISGTHNITWEARRVRLYD